jgi:integrase
MDNPSSLPTINKPEQAERPPTPLQIAGQVANQAAGRSMFDRYKQEKSENTLKRHARDLELFAEYLLDIGIPLVEGGHFQDSPVPWRGITWGVVEGFLQWLLREGYAISSVNARLSTVKVYSQMAVKAGAIDREEGLLIQSVRGFSRKAGLNVDAQRPQTRKEDIVYDYKPDGHKRRVVIERRSTKKRRPTLLAPQQAAQLMQPANPSPQAWRDALLASLLLEHGLRASELALLTTKAIDLQQGLLQFYRPKVKGTAHETAVHKLTPDVQQLAAIYLQRLYPTALSPNSPLILATTRLLKNGEGGHLLGEGLNRVRLSERIAYLGRQIGIPKLSAHDCRHYCATQMARKGYGVDELMAWFGWSSAQTAMRYVSTEEVQERNKG